VAKKKPAAALPPEVQDFLDRFVAKTDSGAIRETYTAVTSLIGPSINRHRARADRADALGRLIHDIVSRQHDISARNVIKRLRGQQGLGVIEDVTDDTVTWIRDGGQLADTSFAAVASRVSGARKKAGRGKKSG
jgi:hypothetical protein